MKKLIIALSCLVAASCTSDNDFAKVKSQLEAQGYTNIKRGGHAWYCCSEDDSFATKFTATNPAGEKVEGCACSGVLKGVTIRWE
jgi:hypothetical protein